MRKRLRAPRPALAVAAALIAVGLALGACGSRDEPDLSNGKAQFVEKCGQCHQLARAGTAGTQGPSLDAAFQAALTAGIDRDTVQGIVEDQVANPNISMPAKVNIAAAIWLRVRLLKNSPIATNPAPLHISTREKLRSGR